MARVKIVKPNRVDDPIIQEIFSWVTDMEGAVPNHFYVEMNFPEYLKAKLGSTKVLWQLGELTLPEIQHIGILVSKANGCPYCTAAFCTILNYGLKTEEGYVKALAEEGLDMVEDNRLRTMLDVALKANNDPKSVSDDDLNGLRDIGLSDKGIVQLIHLVSDFSSYNRLNLALQTDYDYRDMWRTIAFGWDPESGEPVGDNTRGISRNT
ncbi:MAG: carboxymuconolactone decarboxylase family protein [Candidatus Thiodiazotropha sp. (ex Clathrolucina costata)]|nr:carboxymuconolactone decarboxylase family protein [Candidatus Thiodiazotropha taylori]MCG7861027.1 carboxymuconolactone decarboxylase family protein [Candidatus Thiodiazotropha endolucinida]